MKIHRKIVVEWCTDCPYHEWDYPKKHPHCGLTGKTIIHEPNEPFPKTCTLKDDVEEKKK